MSVIQAGYSAVRSRFQNRREARAERWGLVLSKAMRQQIAGADGMCQILRRLRQSPAIIQHGD